MEFALKSRQVRGLLMLAEVAFFVVFAGWIVKTYVAYALSRRPTVPNLQLAVELDPSNAEYHLALARLYQYNIADLQPEKALEHMRRAARLSPHSPQSWLELAAALGFQRKTAEAEACLRRADLLAPNVPAVQWPVANFYLLQGNVDEAFRHFRVLLAGTSHYDQVVFNTAWKASGDAEKILRELIPRHLPTEFSYLNYLLSSQRLEESRAVWKRIMSAPDRFAAQQAAGYIDTLINARRPEEAFRVWTDLQERGLIRSLARGGNENLLVNGDFEDELINMGFAWRILPLEGVYAGLDTSTYQSPSHALLVQFPGKQNLDYRQVLQFVKVSPGQSYRLQAFMKTEGITTDSGPRLEVRDAYDPAALDQFTEDLLGSTSGWSSLVLDFRTGPKTELLVVGLARLPSRKLDNLIGGRVWVDDVRLTRAPE